MNDATGPERALKRLKNRASPQRLSRFSSELNILKSLSHPNVVSIVDFNVGTDDDDAYLVTELLLRDLASIEGNLAALALTEKLRLFEEVCAGLAHAHENGIVHRDIKPENILLAERGKAVLTDFGIAYVEGGERQTLLDEAVGGRNFIAPELENGRATTVTRAADVYSLGKLLYWLLSDGRTFSRERHREAEWTVLGLREFSLEHQAAYEHLNELLDKMITAEPSDRYTDANEVLTWLRTKRYLIERGFPPLSPKVPHLCRYCGVGRYQLRVDGDSTAIYNFGLTQVGGSAPWHALVCDNCGHVELFRVDRGSWWGPGPRG